jgi:aminodeoxyfutalosine synthase
VVPSILPTPIGEPQGLDTLAFFSACRLAVPGAHLVADLELLGLKLGQLCLSFGADELMGSILERRELRLGARTASNELDRGEAAQLLRAAGFVPCERLPDGKGRAP